MGKFGLTKMILKILEKFFEDILVKKFYNIHDLFETGVSMWKYKHDKFKIPFFGIRFICELERTQKLILKYSKKYYKKFNNSYFNNPFKRRSLNRYKSR